MLKNCVSIIIFLAFSVSTFSSTKELFSFHGEEKVESKIEHSLGYTTIISTSNCDDCQDEGCNHEAEHCIHHCSGIHNILPHTQTLSINNPFWGIVNGSWDYRFLYTQPILDPALKPPLFS